jgi:hypothetical protein
MAPPRSGVCAARLSPEVFPARQGAWRVGAPAPETFGSLFALNPSCFFFVRSRALLRGRSWLVAADRSPVSFFVIAAAILIQPDRGAQAHNLRLRRDNSWMNPRTRSDARSGKHRFNSSGTRETEREIGKERSRRGGQDQINLTSRSLLPEVGLPCTTISYLPYAKYASHSGRRQYRLSNLPARCIAQPNLAASAKILPDVRNHDPNSIRYFFHEPNPQPRRASGAFA